MSNAVTYLHYSFALTLTDHVRRQLIRWLDDLLLYESYIFGLLPFILELLPILCISCISFFSTIAIDTAHSRYGPALHSTYANSRVKFNKIELSKSPTGDKYVLLLCDDHSGYTWFYPAESTSADTVVSELIDWSTDFGVPIDLMADFPTNLRNETFRLLKQGFQTTKHSRCHTSHCRMRKGVIWHGTRAHRPRTAERATNETGVLTAAH